MAFVKLRSLCPPRPDQMTVSPATRRPGLPLHWKMGIGFAVGLLLGLAVYY
ncbi:dicarboxylate/amino acid:cation symporter, partial [Xanthomonas perforans]